MLSAFLYQSFHITEFSNSLLNYAIWYMGHSFEDSSRFYITHYDTDNLETSFTLPHKLLHKLSYIMCFKKNHQLKNG